MRQDELAGPALRSEKSKAKNLAKAYRPNPHERAALEAYRTRAEERPLAPRLRVTEDDGATTICPDHPKPDVGNVLLMDALGTRDWDFLQGFLAQLASAAGSKGGKVDGQTLNFMLSVVKGIEPKDQVEALLAAQMAAVHTAFMTFAFRLAHVKTLPQQDSAERTFNKLARTFATQMEALKRYRRRGDQTVRVEHVTVNEGGQAIVGNVRHGGGRSRDDGS
jgi:hypothetical protein